MINVECMNKVEDIYEDGGKTILDFKELPYYDGDQYDLNDEKSFKKYMQSLEYTVRNSFEYRSLINYLRNTSNMNKCSVLNIEAEPGSKVRIELHHTPLTLYDICLAVLMKRIDKKEPIGINDVAEEVMYLHYIGWVGLMPLCATVHETVHNGYMFLPTDKVRGNYRAFVESYYNYIAPDTLDAIDNAERATKESFDDERKQIFNNHKIYINANGSYAIPRKTEAQDTIRNHIADLKNGERNRTGRIMCTIVDKSNPTTSK